MTQVKEIKKAIQQLPKKEYTRIRRWLMDMDWKEWDKQFEEDAKSGKLDTLAEKLLPTLKMARS